jgi:hypothetical protein
MNDDPKKMSPEELEKFVHRELRSLPPRKAPAGFEARFQAKLEARLAAKAFSPEQLEKLVHAELRALPPRRAPRTLESRVLAAIEARNAIPWWHKSWSYWPKPVKTAFVAGSSVFAATALVGLTLLGRAPQADALAHQVGERVDTATTLLAFGTWVVEFAGRVVGGIPALWLYGGLALIATLYATFFGLGAVAYRTLYRTH